MVQIGKLRSHDQHLYRCPVEHGPCGGGGIEATAVGQHVGINIRELHDRVGHQLQGTLRLRGRWRSDDDRTTTRQLLAVSPECIRLHAPS